MTIRSDAAQRGQDSDLGWTLPIVFRAYLKAADAVAAGIPGDHRGRQVLAVAARDEPRSQSALAQRLGIDKTVMTYLLDALAEAGLVERLPDPHDRRNRRVAATARGLEVLAEADRRLRLAEDHLLGCLDEDERATLRALLGRLATHADQLDPLADTCSVVEEIAARG